MDSTATTGASMKLKVATRALVARALDLPDPNIQYVVHACCNRLSTKHEQGP